MDSLGKALDCLCDDYDDVDTPKRPPWPFGNPTAAVAYEAFTKDASERTEALSDWCDDISDTVSSTSEMAEATDDEQAREFMSEAEKLQQCEKPAVSERAKLLTLTRYCHGRA